ncbi:Ig-like domain-containing protein [Pseudomonas zeae]|uniref:Bacterial Ig-like domain-containing protein n=1 Tax=Pseudomonas zeae TaxID=2745510 RepID=A0A9E6NP05_9PSED|nr:Ig-like domain-containing protein [Pseudomonas zeae]QXI11246.1 hypothetical protein HU754_026240 [Pseudomonas zeae]
MEGKELRQEIPLRRGSKDSQIKIKATPDGKYILADKATGFAPENITVRRVGKDLHVSLEGEPLDPPTVIIEDFFQYNSELLGMAESGAYYFYVSSDADDDRGAIAFLQDGDSSGLVLGGEQVVNVEKTAAFALLPWAAGAIGVGAGASALGGKGGGGSKDSAPQQPAAPTAPADPTPPAVVPALPVNPEVPVPGINSQIPKIGEMVDSKGSIQGVIEKGGVTDDTTPTINGTGEPGDTIIVLDKGEKIDETTVDENGNWKFIPPELSEGDHEITVVIKDQNGNESKPSEPWEVIVDTLAPDAPTLVSVYDDADPKTGEVALGGVTDDTTPTLSGNAEAGSTVAIFDNGQKLGETRADANGNWSFTPATPLIEGEHSFTVQATDIAGNASELSKAWDLVIAADNNNPITDLIDDQGSIQGPIEKGGVTDDTTPTINGTGEPGDTIIILDKGEKIGETTVDEDGNWKFTPETELGDGDHEITVVIQDPAGNQSNPSDPWEFTVDTQAPDAPSISSVYDDAGVKTGELAFGAITDDTTPTLSGNAEAGSTVAIFDNGQKLGETRADANGNWSFTPATPLIEGEHSFTVQATDIAGNASDLSEAWDVVIDTTAPEQPGIDGQGPGISGIIDDQGAVQGPIENGGVTDDTTPTINGTGEPGDTIIVLDKGEKIGETTVDEDGNWKFTRNRARRWRPRNHRGDSRSCGQSVQSVRCMGIHRRHPGA